MAEESIATTQAEPSETTDSAEATTIALQTSKSQNITVDNNNIFAEVVTQLDVLQPSMEECVTANIK